MTKPRGLRCPPVAGPGSFVPRCPRCSGGMEPDIDSFTGGSVDRCLRCSYLRRITGSQVGADGIVPPLVAKAMAGEPIPADVVRARRRRAADRLAPSARLATGGDLRAARERRGLTVGEAAAKVGTAIASWRVWEHGATPQRRFHPLLAHHFGVRFRYAGDPLPLTLPVPKSQSARIGARKRAENMAAARAAADAAAAAFATLGAREG